jgi:hypothetical protein
MPIILTIFTTGFLAFECARNFFDIRLGVLPTPVLLLPDFAKV